MELIEAVINDAAYSLVEQTDLFKDFYERANIEIIDCDFSNVDITCEQSLYFSLVYNYIEQIIIMHEIDLDVDDIDIDYYNGISIYVDEEDLNLMNCIEQFNTISEIKIEIR